MEKVIIPIVQEDMNVSYIQEYSLGMCLVTYHKGFHQNLKDTFSRLKEYINVNQLKIRGDIVTTSIINSFIVNNENEYLKEIKIPIIS